LGQIHPIMAMLRPEMTMKRIIGFRVIMRLSFGSYVSSIAKTQRTYQH